MAAEWVRIGFSAAFIFAGLAIVVIAIVGIYRFNFILNRMHIAAAADTLGLLLITVGLIILDGIDPSTLKLIVIVVFFWMANPVVGHLIMKLEVDTIKPEDLKKECEVIES